MAEAALCDKIAWLGKSLFDRGLTFGSSGNISVRLEDGWLMTPTGSSLGGLDPARLAKIDAAEQLVAGDPPTKEAFLHTLVYDRRLRAGAVVHLHCTHSVAVSCLCGQDHTNVLPPLTAYYVMRIGTLPPIPHFAPGDIDLAWAVGECVSRHHAVLLANHGPVVAGKTLYDAVYATEELEETAKLFLALRGMETCPLTQAQVDDLHKRYPLDF